MADTADLVPLAELDDGGLAAGEPDARGWEVNGADGGRIGQVADLVVERQSGRVRFLDVDLDDELAEARAASLPAATDELRGLEAAHLAVREWPQITGDTLLGDVNPAGTSPPAPPPARRGWREVELLPAAGPRPPRLGLDRVRSAADLADAARHVLIPVHGLRLDPRAEQVVVPGLSASAAAALPPYRPGEPLPGALWNPVREAVENRIERGVEGEEERFYTQSDPRFTPPLPPDPGTTPAELEETDAAGLAPDPSDDGRPRQP
jgi:hypothetical protein